MSNVFGLHAIMYNCSYNSIYACERVVIIIIIIIIIIIA